MKVTWEVDKAKNRVGFVVLNGDGRNRQLIREAARKTPFLKPEVER